MSYSVFLKAGKKLKAGQEIFIDYGYKEFPFPEDHPWYWALKAKVDREIEENKQREAKVKPMVAKQKKKRL